MFFVASSALVLATYLLVRHSMTAEFRRLNFVDIKAKRGGPPLPDTKVVDIGADGTPITVGDLKSRITAEQQEALTATTSSLLTISVATAVAGGLLALVVGWLMSGRVIRPLQTISATAESIAGSNLHRRIRMRGPRDELKRLADTFDAMLERLDRSFDGQRRFVGNASHELRTPLAVSRTLIQVAMDRPGSSDDLRKLGTDLLAINTQQVQLTDALLTLARSDQELTETQPVDVGAVTTGVVDRARDAARSAGVELSTHIQAAIVPGDPVLLTQLVENLVRNAIDYNRPGGQAVVTVATDPGQVRLTVDNSGDPIDPAAIPGLFEPFRRLGTPRTGDTEGIGLGLSIVRSIAHAHHGAVVAAARPEGGLTLNVTLPRLRRPDHDQRRRSVHP